jgi:hypothetical protein
MRMFTTTCLERFTNVKMEVTHEADSLLMKMIVLLITHSSVILYSAK